MLLNTVGTIPQGPELAQERGAVKKVGMEGPALGPAAWRARRVSSQQRTLSVPFSHWEHPLSMFLEKAGWWTGVTAPPCLQRGQHCSAAATGPRLGCWLVRPVTCDGIARAPRLWGQLGTFWTSQGDRQALVEAAHQGKGYRQLGFSVLPSLFLCQLCT